MELAGVGEGACSGGDNPTRARCEALTVVPLAGPVCAPADGVVPSGGAGAPVPTALLEEAPGEEEVSEDEAYEEDADEEEEEEDSDSGAEAAQRAAAPRDSSFPLIHSLGTTPSPAGPPFTTTPPPNPFPLHTLKWWAYQALIPAGEAGLLVEDVLEAMTSQGFVLSSSRTPANSITSVMSQDPAFAWTGARRYALAFLRYRGKPPAVLVKRRGRPPGPGRGTKQARMAGGRGDARHEAAPGGPPRGLLVSSAGRPQREAAARAQAGIAILASDERRPGAPPSAGAPGFGSGGSFLSPAPDAAGAALAAMRRCVPAQPLVAFPAMASRQVLSGMVGPLSSFEEVSPEGVYVLRADGMQRQSTVLRPEVVPPKHALVWFDAGTGRAYARAGRTQAAMRLNGEAVAPFQELLLQPGHSLALSGADYWRGEALPAQLAPAAAAAAGPLVAGLPVAVASSYKDGWRGYGRTPGSAAGSAQERRPVVLQSTPLTVQQHRMAEGADDAVLALLAAPIPPGMTVHSWREEKRDIDNSRRQYLFFLTDASSGAEVLAVVGVETTRWHPKFTITPQAVGFASQKPPSMVTKKRMDITDFLHNCVGAVCEEGRPGGLPQQRGGKGWSRDEYGDD